MKRQYASVDDFLEAKDKAEKLRGDSIWGNKPSDYALAEIRLADDEEYRITEYDGKETIELRKKGEIKSTLKTIDEIKYARNKRRLL